MVPSSRSFFSLFSSSVALMVNTPGARRYTCNSFRGRGYLEFRETAEHITGECSSLPEPTSAPLPPSQDARMPECQNAKRANWHSESGSHFAKWRPVERVRDTSARSGKGSAGKRSTTSPLLIVPFECHIAKSKRCRLGPPTLCAQRGIRGAQPTSAQPHCGVAHITMPPGRRHLRTHPRNRPQPE